VIYHSRSTEGIPGTLDDLGATVHASVEKLLPLRDQFDSIVVTGLSGVIVGVPVALLLDRPVVILRRPDDSAHDGLFVNLARLGQRVCFLDDFVRTGGTRGRVLDMLKREGVELTIEHMYRDNTVQNYNHEGGHHGRR
jgi:adenine/guanine phosphoribosyltransferase-like PRPP-binding protein